MTADELADLHPHLFHITAPGNGERIKEHGLYPTRDLAAHLSTSMRDEFLRTRREDSVPIAHPEFGLVTINDNKPIVLSSLSDCLDDGLTAADWLEMLNSRVFFFTSKAKLGRLENARANREKPRDKFVVDTLKLASAYASLMEIVPFNSGNTQRKPARRGLSTFAPLESTNYALWQHTRPKKSPDKIAEVTVRGAIPDFSSYIIDYIPGGVS
jgi:hypothetical protein